MSISRSAPFADRLDLDLANHPFRSFFTRACYRWRLDQILLRQMLHSVSCRDIGRVRAGNRSGRSRSMMKSAWGLRSVIEVQATAGDDADPLVCKQTAIPRERSCNKYPTEVTAWDVGKLTIAEPSIFAVADMAGLAELDNEGAPAPSTVGPSTSS